MNAAWQPYGSSEPVGDEAAEGDEVEAETYEPVIWSPTAHRRHREDVNVSALPMPASMVEVEVAMRPGGGKRRAADPADTGEQPRVVTDPGEEQTGRRAAHETTETILVNATDAAEYLAMRQEFWTSTQILSHSEIARLAVAEVRKSLTAEIEALGKPGVFNRKAKKARSDLDRQVADLWNVAELLAQAHNRNLVKGD